MSHDIRLSVYRQYGNDDCKIKKNSSVEMHVKRERSHKTKNQSQTNRMQTEGYWEHLVRQVHCLHFFVGLLQSRNVQKLCGRKSSCK